MSKTANITEAYVSAFAEAAPALPGHGIGWLDGARNEAIKAFAACGLPHPRAEAWRYTNLSPLGKTAFAPSGDVAGIAARPVAPEALGPGPQVVFNNGRLVTDLTALRINGLEINSLAGLLADAPDLVEHLLGRAPSNADDGIDLLNEAFMRDGYVLRLAAGVVLEQPVEIVHLTSAGARAASFSRNVVIAGDGSRLTIIERYLGEGDYWNNIVTGLEIGEGAEVEHYIRQGEGPDAVHMMTRNLSLASRSRYHSFALTTGAAVGRDETRLSFNGDQAAAKVDGVFLGGGEQSRDTLIRADHLTGNTFSNQRFKGILAGRAKGTFQGTVHIAEGAADTEAHQSCNSLILERGAEANAKPELLIYADEVKCSHGATVGELDKSALFYMLSRGIDEATATGMLIEAFAADVVELIGEDAVRESFAADIAGWMASHRAGAGQS